MGAPILDPIASLIICTFILKAAWDIFWDAVQKMVDRSGEAELEARIRALAEAECGVHLVQQVRTRQFGSRIYAEVCLCLNGTLSLEQARQVAGRVHNRVERELSIVKHCTVAIAPPSEGDVCTKEEGPGKEDLAFVSTVVKLR